uniref:Toll-like receptor 6 n=1 Tax=Ascaris lumbricoides TaxID=6252 RepID=A0A0M3HYU2_ASCLU
LPSEFSDNGSKCLEGLGNVKTSQIHCSYEAIKEILSGKVLPSLRDNRLPITLPCYEDSVRFSPPQGCDFPLFSRIKRILEGRQSLLPSYSFLRAYFSFLLQSSCQWHAVSTTWLVSHLLTCSITDPPDKEDSGGKTVFIAVIFVSASLFFIPAAIVMSVARRFYYMARCPTVIHTVIRSNHLNDQFPEVCFRICTEGLT